MVGVAAQLGDLMESMIKRDCDRKDASSAVPGFGGVLDVLDSLLFAAPGGLRFLARFRAMIVRSWPVFHRQRTAVSAVSILFPDTDFFRFECVIIRGCWSVGDGTLGDPVSRGSGSSRGDR